MMSVELEEETLEELSPDGPISSLRRIQALYGALAEAAGDVGGDPAYSIYYTPGDLEEFVATSENPDRYLVRLDVDLTSEGVSATDVSVEIERLTDDVLPKLGYARYPPGRGIDHSITHRGSKNGSNADTIVGYCEDRLERWTNGDGREPAIGEVRDEHPDGWILERLQTLGASEEAKQRIDRQVRQQVTGEPNVVTAVRLHCRTDDLSKGSERVEGESDWLYPGDVDVLNEAMKARKESKLATKNETESRGEAACMVSGELEDVIGTAQDPFGFFTVKHAEKFAEISRAKSWRSHSISTDAALLLQSGGSLLDSCRTTRNGLGVYTLPYFTSMDGDRAELLYSALRELEQRDEDASDRHPMVFLEDVVEKEGTSNDLESLRFYSITLLNNSGDINVFTEVPDVTLYWPRQIATQFEKTVTESTAFSAESGLGGDDSWDLVSSSVEVPDIVNDIVGGRLAWSAVTPTDEDSEAAVNNEEEWLSHQLLTGQDVPASRILDAFVAKLRAERRADDEDRLSTNTVEVQFALLESLARSGLLTAAENRAELAEPPHDMYTENTDISAFIDDGETIPRPRAREQRLNRFIEDREALASSAERRTAFLVGVLVGQLSHHQRRSRDMNRTFRDQYQAEQMTPGRLKRLYPELEDKAGIYAGEVGWATDVLFESTLDALHESISRAIPDDDDWEISREDLQFFYALGVGYGTRGESRLFEVLEAAKQQIEKTENQ